MTPQPSGARIDALTVVDECFEGQNRLDAERGIVFRGDRDGDLVASGTTGGRDAAPRVQPTSCTTALASETG